MAAGHAARNTTAMIHKKEPLENIRVFDGECFPPLRTMMIDDAIIGKAASGVNCNDGKGWFLLPGVIRRLSESRVCAE